MVCVFPCSSQSCPRTCRGASSRLTRACRDIAWPSPERSFPESCVSTLTRKTSMDTPRSGSGYMVFHQRCCLFKRHRTERSLAENNGETSGNDREPLYWRGAVTYSKRSRTRAIGRWGCTCICISNIRGANLTMRPTSGMRASSINICVGG